MIVSLRLWSRAGAWKNIDICITTQSSVPLSAYFYAPAIRWQGGISCLLCPSFRLYVASKVVFSTPPTSLHWFEWNFIQMLYHKSRSACGKIIHVRQILAELWSLTRIIFTHFRLSSQLLLHLCMNLNETWQGCFTTCLEVNVGK